MVQLWGRRDAQDVARSSSQVQAVTSNTHIFSSVSLSHVYECGCCSVIASHQFIDTDTAEQPNPFRGDVLRACACGICREGSDASKGNASKSFLDCECLRLQICQIPVDLEETELRGDPSGSRKHHWDRADV